MPNLRNVTGGDKDAIHDNEAAEIVLITEKLVPVAGDWLIIEDSADANNKKRVQIGNLGANRALSNLTSPTAINQDLVPNGVQSIGIFSNRWQTVFTKVFSVANTGTKYTIDGSGGTTPSGALAGVTTIIGSNAIASSLSIHSINSSTADANATGPLFFETGNKTAGTGDSGNLTFYIGTSVGGTRGKIKLIDGSEGTIGHVWTSTGVGGEGAWSAAGAADNLGNHTATQNIDLVTFDLISNDGLKASDSQASNYWGASVVGYFGDSATLAGGQQAVFFASTDSAVAGTATANVEVMSGDQTAAAATGQSGGVEVKSGDVTSGTATTGTGGLTVTTGTNVGSGSSGPLNLNSGLTAGGNSGVVVAKTGNSTSGDSGTLRLQTGSAAGGTSGNVLLQTGTGSVRGTVQIIDGSEGTIGHVWTSTGVLGQGNWAAAVGADNLGNHTATQDIDLVTFDLVSDNGLFASDSTVSSFLATTAPGFYGDTPTLEAGPGAITFGTTDSAVVAENTSDVVVQTGDKTAAGATGTTGALTLLSGNITGGPASTASSGPVVLRSGDNPSDGPTGSVSISSGATVDTATGKVTIGSGGSTTGATGDTEIRTGTTGGARGTINMLDGSEGTVGDIWTSTGVAGEGNWAAPAAHTTSVATATGDTSTTSATYVAMATMTITPAAGDYLAIFSASGGIDVNNRLGNYALYNNAVQVAHTERDKAEAAGQQNAMHTTAIVTMAGGQALDVRYQVDNPGGPTATFTVHERSLTLIKMS
jgi:hypothetical protein